MRLSNFLIDQKNRIVMAKKPINKLRFAGRQNPDGDFKPKGLWYGFGNSWIVWCKSEMPEWIGSFHYLLEVNESKILTIDGYDKLYEFTKKYGTIAPGLPDKIKFYDIAWQKVADLWSGIEINPYVGKARHELGWYYSWDVASGCIWKHDAVKSFEEIKE